MSNEQRTYIAKANWRNELTSFGIYDTDRLQHIHVLGKTGTGKSSLIKTMMVQDIRNGNGCALFDPHGDLVEEVQQYIPKERTKDVVYLDLTNPNLSYGYNPLRKVPYEMRALVASGILEVFEKLWHKAWGVRLEHIMRNAILSVLDMPQADLRDIPRVVLDKSYRKEVITHIQNPEVKNFWRREFPKYTDEALTPVLNKLGGMLTYPVIRRFLIENNNRLSFRTLMDQRKVVLVNLSKGHIGSDCSNIIGSLLIHAIGLAGMSRASIEENKRKPFFIYVDEFHNFATLSFINFLSELRKFKLSFLLAHQYLAQLSVELQKAVIGNVGTSLNFRLGADDAHTIARSYIGVFKPEDFLYLPNYHVYLSLMIRGQASRGFSAVTFRSPDEVP